MEKHTSLEKQTDYEGWLIEHVQRENPAVRDGRLATVRGHAFTAEDHVRWTMIGALMCDFRIDYDRVAAEVPAYGAHVADQVARLGRDHPIVKTQYYLETIDAEGGLRVVAGDIGRAIVKVSAVNEEFHRITAPAKVFTTQAAFIDAFNDGELEQDFVAVDLHHGALDEGVRAGDE